MAKRIASAIRHILKVCKKTPISMKWKGDSSKENQRLVETKNEIGEERDPIENDSVSAGNNNNNNNNNNRREEAETATKASRRCQKIPVTRNDFLWTATSKKQSR
jgi:hypothetical protein